MGINALIVTNGGYFSVSALIC